MLDEIAVIAAPVTLLAVTISTIAVIAGWNRRSEQLARRSHPSGRLAPFAIPSRGNAGTLELAAEAMALLHRFEALAARRFVALEQAVQPGLAVHMNPSVLHDILGEILTVAIERSPGGRVLLTAAQVGCRAQVTVSDDGQESDRNLRANWLRRAQGLAALQGATMDIDARAGQGTTVVLWLPVGAGPSSGEPAPFSEAVWDAPQPVAQNSNADR